jgi:hypothetical protein
MSHSTPPVHAGAGAQPRRALRLVVLGAVLALATAHCTFPSYNTPPPDAGGSGGAGGSGVGGSGAAAAAAGVVTTGAAGHGGGGGGSVLPSAGQGGVAEVGGAPELGGLGATGGAPECAPEQWPVDRCEGGCLHRLPDHCYDGKTSGDELELDCGGSCQRCTNEACTLSNACLSGNCVIDGQGLGSCYAPLSIRFTMHERNSVVGSTAWSIALTNDEPVGGQVFKFSDLKLRYYFARSGITEPVLVRATQSNLTLLNGQARALSKTTWTLQRTESLPGGAYDAYVEVGFGDAGQLFPGDRIDLYQQMLTGEPGASSFDQRANYSFTDQTDSAWLHVTVFDDDKLVWGLEPRPIDPRVCFVRAVNLNGPALVIDGHDFQSAAQAAIATTGSGIAPASTPYPPVTGSLATMLQTATRLQTGDELNLPVDNGVYLAYLYATSPTNDGVTSVFTVQGAEPELGGRFRSQAADGGQAWSRLGPFRVDVTTGKLTLGVTSGSVSFTGIELWYPE